MDQQGAEGRPGEGKAIGSTGRSRTSQSQENLMAPLPSTFNTDLKALLKEALQESEQGADSFNNRCKMTQARIKRDQEDRLGTTEKEDLEVNIYKARWDCGKAFKEIARGFQPGNCAP